MELTLFAINSIFHSNETERAVRPQGIGISMITCGNHTIMQLGSNDTLCTVHAFAAGCARHALSAATRRPPT